MNDAIAVPHDGPEKRDTTHNIVRRDLAQAIDELGATLHALVDHVSPLLICDLQADEPSDALSYVSSTPSLREIEDEAGRVRQYTALVSRLRGSIEV